ncbi:MAG: LysE family transporter [Rhodovibrionaceae bacterium]
MVSFVLLIKAILIGFVVAIPVGALGAFTVQLALSGRWLRGFVAGLGGALADTVIAGAAFYGLSLLLSWLNDHGDSLQLLGGAFLIVFGIAMIAKKPRHLTEQQLSISDLSLGMGLRDVLTGFSLTIFNPTTLMAFLGIFAGFGLFGPERIGELNELWASSLLAFGVFAGAALWWLLLSLGTASLRHHLPENMIAWVSRALGLVVAGFGVAALLNTL